MGAGTELDSPASAGAPARLPSPWPGGSAAAPGAAPGRPRRPFGEAGLRRQVGGGGDPVAGVRPAGISSRSSLNSAEAGDVKLTREADEGGRTEGDLCLPVSPGIAVCF